MAMGRTFQESFQKALRGLEVGVDGLDEKTTDLDTIKQEMGVPGPERIWYVADAFRVGLTVDEVFQYSKIDPWFLVQIKDIIDHEQALKGKNLADLDKDTLFKLKRLGFSDRRLALLLDTDQHAVRYLRS
jgi:carbamoyl-phosphate synthase large subunit